MIVAKRSTGGNPFAKHERTTHVGYKIEADTIILGCDVGKTSHQIHAIKPDLTLVGRRKIANTPTQIGEVFDWARQHGQPVLVVDQKASYAALLRHVAAESNIAVVYVTGLQARRATDLTPGRAKTDRIDAAVIAEFARNYADQLPALEPDEELNTALRLLVGRDDDLRCDFNRCINRIRDLLTSYAPTLETAFGAKLTRKGVLSVFTRWPDLAGIRRARFATIQTVIAEHNPRLAAKAAELFKKHTPSGDRAGQPTAGTIVAELADQAIMILEQRAELETQLTELAQTHDDYNLVESVPGMGPKTTVRFIAEIGDIRRFPTGGHLASYAGLAPVNRQSGTGLNTVKKDRAGNHRLKNTLFLSAFIASRFDPTAKAHYQKQRNRGKHHNAATIAVTRKRCDLLHAILTKRNPYKPLTT